MATLASLPSKQGLKRRACGFLAAGNKSSRFTSIKTRIETQMGGGGRGRAGYSRFTSIKTRIETFFPISVSDRNVTLASLPSKQGLKPMLELPRSNPPGHSRFTSIKTRIETHHMHIERNDARLPLASLPSKQGLKPRRERGVEYQSKRSRFTSIKTRIETRVGRTATENFATSRFTSIKTRIETRSRNTFGRVGHALASLPSKQGLKRPLLNPFIYRRELSLHFHQNKD